MTALNQYSRLEAVGLWRADTEEQRIEVFVTIGEATLVIIDNKDQALAHWSLAAIARSNPGQLPAIFHPDGDPNETLELSENASEMIEAIETLRHAIERRRPHPGRLRLITMLASFSAVVVLGVFWLPKALLDHTVSVVPMVKRTEIGADLLARIQTVTGAPCGDAQNGRPATEALAMLGNRLPAPNGRNSLVVLRDGIRKSAHLPGGFLLLNADLIEGFDQPDVVAGYIVAERLRMAVRDPLDTLLSHAGLAASFRLLTTGALSEEMLQDYAEYLLTAPQLPLDNATLLAGFRAWSVSATPYAYAIDPTGESTLPLIEADPFKDAASDQVMNDADWLRLQSICDG